MSGERAVGVPVDVKALTIVVAFLAAVATPIGVFAVLQYRASASEARIDKVETNQDADHDKLIEMAGQIKNIDEKVEDIAATQKQQQAEMAQQQVLLMKIYEQVTKP